MRIPLPIDEVASTPFPACILTWRRASFPGRNRPSLRRKLFGGLGNRSLDLRSPGRPHGQASGGYTTQAERRISVAEERLFFMRRELNLKTKTRAFLGNSPTGRSFQAPPLIPGSAALFHQGEITMNSAGVTRRRLMQAAGGTLLLYAVPAQSVLASSASCSTSDWRFCNKCRAMFYRPDDGGVCTDGQPHRAQGYNFILPQYDSGACSDDKQRRETATAQPRWCRCKYCNVLFFNGYRNKGACSANGRKGHEALGSGGYLVPHDVPGTPTAQTEWRFCNKCHAMFYDGYGERGAEKGQCPAGGGHIAQGYGFVLPHSRPPTGVLR
ncbi:hypothetical protein [Lysobacter sp. CA199]|uniref:hypothetical protein n=1 Tax=Lysobacter sp. CA199 TaxID=3455608 RepID=UPI003F8D1C1F